MVSRNTFKRAVVLGVGIILLGVCCCLAVIVSQPCSWLDLSLHYTGCVRQLDIGAHFNGVFNDDFTMFGGATANGGISIWRINDGRLLFSIPGSGSNGDFSPDGAFFVVNLINSPDTITIWNTQDWVLQSTLETNTEMVTDIAIAPDMSSLAVAGWNGLVQVWRTSDRKLHTLEGHKNYVDSIAYSPDGTILASGGWDHMIRLWRVEDGRLLNTLKGHTSVVEKVIFAPDGKTLASAGADDTVRIWRTDDGTPQYTLKGHDGYVLDLAYSPDGSILASAESRGVVQLWNVNNGTLIQTLRQNWILLEVYAIAFSPDGRTLATVQRYGPIRLYNVQQLLGVVTD